MAGEYRPILTEQFKKDGNDVLSKAIADKTLMIAISRSIQGNVTVRKELTPLFLEALKKGDSLDHEKYQKGLESGRMVPVESFNGKTSLDKIYASGELYFTT